MGRPTTKLTIRPRTDLTLPKGGLSGAVMISIIAMPEKRVKKNKPAFSRIQQIES